MSEKKLFVGYDLGDGETITDMSKTDSHMNVTQITDMTMPGMKNNLGRAIPTAYGYSASTGNLLFAKDILETPEDVIGVSSNFKRRPSDLLGVLSESQMKNYVSLFQKEKWPSKEECPELYSPQFESFKKSVQIFTNAIFEHIDFSNQISQIANSLDEVSFWVGHPTKWNELDVLIYYAILRDTVLGAGEYCGTKSSLHLEKESRAAYLYIRQFYNNSSDTNGKDELALLSGVLPKGSCVVLIDIGSSTIDVTAMTADARNYQYNNGDNYLGARSIDFIIKNWYLQQLDDESLSLYNERLTHNSGLDQSLVLKCRLDAKEKAYSGTEFGKGSIDFIDLPIIRTSKQIINDLAYNYSVAEALQSANITVPKKRLTEMGNKSWATLFREFLNDQKVAMETRGLKIGTVVMTGSASRMSFVPDIVKSVFPGIRVLSDVNPSRSISKGLALIGPADQKSEHFQHEVKDLIDVRIPQIVSQDMSALANSLSIVVSEIVSDIIRSNMKSWRAGSPRYLSRMMDNIKDECSEQNLQRRLNESREYNETIRNWTVNIVGKDISNELSAICNKYGVSGFKSEDLNVVRDPISIDPTTGMAKVNPAAELTDALGGLIAIIAGIITATLVPSIVAAILLVIYALSAEIAAVLFSLLAAIPGPGWVILAGIAGIAVARLVMNGIEGIKYTVTNRIQSWDLPDFARLLLTDAKIEEQIQSAEIENKVRDAVSKADSKERIVSSVSDSLKPQVKNLADEIKYFIESQ